MNFFYSLNWINAWMNRNFEEIWMCTSDLDVITNYVDFNVFGICIMGVLYVLLLLIAWPVKTDFNKN